MIPIASWNIWFDLKHRQARTNLIIRILKKEEIEIIALQEVVPETAQLFKEKFPKWHFAGYPITQSYDTLIISKHPIIDSTRIPLPHTNMGRNLLIANIYHQPTDCVIPVATFHLESEFKQMKIVKEMQLIFIYQHFFSHQDGRFIIMGDTNIAQKEKTPEYPPFMKDAFYGAYKPEAYRFTYDGVRNEHITNRRFRSRLDRIYYSKKSLRLESFSFLGDSAQMTSEHDEPIYPSDHFGLLAKFSFI